MKGFRFILFFLVLLPAAFGASIVTIKDGWVQFGNREQCLSGDQPDPSRSSATVEKIERVRDFIKVRFSVNTVRACRPDIMKAAFNERLHNEQLKQIILAHPFRKVFIKSHNDLKPYSIGNDQVYRWTLFIFFVQN